MTEKEFNQNIKMIKLILNDEDAVMCIVLVNWLKKHPEFDENEIVEKVLIPKLLKILKGE